MAGGAEVVLTIGHWYSKCGACGGNADYREVRHENTSMQGDGCGAEYTHVTSEYWGEDESVGRLRPDLLLLRNELPKGGDSG